MFIWPHLTISHFQVTFCLSFKTSLPVTPFNENVFSQHVYQCSHANQTHFQLNVLPGNSFWNRGIGRSKMTYRIMGSRVVDWLKSTDPSNLNKKAGYRFYYWNNDINISVTPRLHFIHDLSSGVFERKTSSFNISLSFSGVAPTSIFNYISPLHCKLKVQRNGDLLLITVHS